MQFFKLFAFVCALGIAAAIPTSTSSFSEFETQLKTIDVRVVELDVAITGFNGNLVQANAVNVAAAAVAKANAAALQALATVAVLTEAQAQEIIVVLTNGVTHVEKTLHDLVGKKSLFVILRLNGLVLSTLLQLQTVAINLGKALLAKTPADLNSQATVLYTRIEVAISGAIKVYKA